MPTTDATQLSEIDRADSVVVAFSGGADSLALLVLLSRFLPSGQLVAVYVNHRLRSEEELAAEERLNQTNCRTLGIPLRIVRLGRDQVSKLAAERDKGLEEAARTLRYEALQRVREELGFSLIATAHTADDQAETMLMRMLQGSSAAGLRGIARRNGHVVRPILSFTRADVLAVVAESGLDCSEDSSNAQLHFLRNRIRSQVVPSIAQVFPGYREALDELARHSRQVMEVLEPLARGVFDGAVRMTDGGAVIELPKLCAHPDALVELVLYRVWDLLRGDERVGRGMIARLLGAVRKREATRIVANGTSVSIEDGVMTWKTGGAALAGGFVSLVYSERTVLDGRMVLIRGGEPAGPVPLHLRARLADADLVGTLVARSIRAGDRIELAAGTTLVSDLLGSWKIDSDRRWRVPVLEDELGIVAVLAGAYGGRDRVARRCLAGTLARNDATLYSVTDMEG